MINEIKQDAEATLMEKVLEAFAWAYCKIRTGRAQPSLLRRNPSGILCAAPHFVN